MSNSSAYPVEVVRSDSDAQMAKAPVDRPVVQPVDRHEALSLAALNRVLGQHGPRPHLPVPPGDDRLRSGTAIGLGLRVQQRPDP